MSAVVLPRRERAVIAAALAGVTALSWLYLVQVAAIAAFVLLEKLLPAGEAVARAAGVAAIGFGAWMIARALG